MAPELRAEAEEIAKNAGELKSEPYSYMKLAHEYTERACDLHPVAFGVICSMLLSSEYESSRSALSNSIKEGVKQLEIAAGGLVKVANTIAKAEVANSADTKAARDPGFKYTEPESKSGLSMAEGMALFGGVSLAAENLAIAVICGASSALAPTAIASIALWAMFTPDDPALSKAVGGWQAVGEQISGVTGGTWEGIGKSLDKNWEGDSKSAFDSWAEIFQAEVEQTKAAAEQNKTALEEIIKSLHNLQNSMFIFAMGCLIAIIAFAVGEKMPYVGPIFAVLKQIQGLILSGGTATTIAAVIGVVVAGLGPLREMFDVVGSNFATLAVNKGGGGTSFKEVNINWATPNVPVPS
ncbi:hypothetical protein [Actinomadura chokoriensis]|uniref:ESX-1 secretion-associated protein EspA/EspE-like domain-containing protein n=1 Tax=Actinomadura chokoriensis TaxID=454156 RepID=A0ABV4R5C2_9ACTN